MRINQWRDRALRVTQAEDVFYREPLAEMTLYRFTSNNVVVDPHAGAFSIKLVLSGSERYEFHRRCVRLRPAQILMVNAGETYSSQVDELSESLSIFYLDRELQDAVRAATSTNEALLDSPDRRAQHVEVAQIPLQLNAAVSKTLANLVQSTDDRDEIRTEDVARELLVDALCQSRGIVWPNVLANVTRRSTRDELTSRAYKAKLYIDETVGQDFQLDDLANVAHLSKYHFLRIFQEVFGETPMAYARRRRLEAARRDLQRGECLPRAARRAGYTDSRAFARAYRRTFGALPGS